MLTKNELDQVLDGVEVGRKFRITFVENAMREGVTLPLQTILGLNRADIIQLEYFADFTILFAIRGSGWGRNRSFVITIGPNYPHFDPEHLKLTLISCLESIESI